MRRLLLVLTAFFALTTPAHAAWVWPVKGEVITPYRNGTDPYATGQHRGIDIAASIGTPVLAAAGGEVRFAGTAGTSGLTIGIRTGDGYDTSYLHLSSLAVRAGARVTAGERIGAVGTTGTRSATAPHLHFGIRDAGTRHAYHDPLAFLPPPSVSPEPNPPAPAPAPAPQPAEPHPTPAPAPTGAHAPRGAPSPLRAPVSRDVPTTRGAPGPRPSPAPGRAAAPGAAPILDAAPSTDANRARRPVPLPALSTEAAPAPERDRAPAAAAAPRRPNGAGAESDPLRRSTLSAAESVPASPLAAKSDEGTPRPTAPGPDIGWALACGGLLLAAAILGLTGDNRRAARRNARIAAILRPLAGRR